jgi:hypothetical protein
MAVEMDLRVGFVGVLNASSFDGFLVGEEPSAALQAALLADPPP